MFISWVIWNNNRRTNQYDVNKTKKFYVMNGSFSKDFSLLVSFNQFFKTWDQIDRNAIGMELASRCKASMLMTRSSKPLLVFSLKELFRETFKAVAVPIRTDAKVKLVYDKSVLGWDLETSITRWFNDIFETCQYFTLLQKTKFEVDGGFFISFKQNCLWALSDFCVGKVLDCVVENIIIIWS